MLKGHDPAILTHLAFKDFKGVGIKIWKSFQVGHTAGHELKQHYAVVGYAPWYTGGHGGHPLTQVGW